MQRLFSRKTDFFSLQWDFSGYVTFLRFNFFFLGGGCGRGRAKFHKLWLIFKKRINTLYMKYWHRKYLYLKILLINTHFPWIEWSRCLPKPPLPPTQKTILHCTSLDRMENAYQSLLSSPHKNPFHSRKILHIFLGKNYFFEFQISDTILIKNIKFSLG